MPRPILVSACLLGLSTRYDGRSKHNLRVLEHLRQNELIPVPVCPEQLAGLPTPRPKTCFAAGDGAAVLNGTGSLIRDDGSEVGRLFVAGAEETLKIARLAGCREALFKERSPSCGVRQVYCRQRIVPGQGVTTALLTRNGLRVYSEEDV
jgi:uncharacterized protein YbbK (DUF523 family)